VSAATAAEKVGEKGGPRPFVFVRDHGERAAEINDFYNGFMKLARPLAAHEWEFKRGPGGPALVWTINETASNRVVGHHSIVPTPMVRRGRTIAGGRTENTIIDPAVRTKVFYPGMERRALGEALQGLDIIYTIHSQGPGRLRERLGYKPIGRWVAYLPRVGPAYLEALLNRARGRLPVPLPAAIVGLTARLAARFHGAFVSARTPLGIEIAEIDDIDTIADEYNGFWEKARQTYDTTIDRSLAFMRWRLVENPHLRFRTWTVRRGDTLIAVIVGHRHSIGSATALYVDDIVAGPYDDDSFAIAVDCSKGLAPEADSIVLMTLAIDTPLHRVLRRRLPFQARALDRFGEKLFDQLLAYDKSTDGDAPWYVTAIFTEGMDTSRDAVG
jgi:hypothetical protein